jgi:hypothetical protein
MCGNVDYIFQAPVAGPYEEGNEPPLLLARQPDVEPWPHLKNDASRLASL